MRSTAAVPFPRAPLFGAITAVGVIVAAVAFARLSDMAPTSGFESGEPVVARTVSFADAGDGSVRVTDADTGEIISVIPPGTNGFLRGALRGISRARKRDSGDLAAPYRLALWKNGHLTIEDPVIGAKIDLEAFGPTNSAVFKAFLPNAKGDIK